MARQDKKLTVIKIKRLDQPGRYNDGGGLYLLVKSGGGKYWLFRYRDRTTGKHRDKGLGSCIDVTLARAREKAAEHRASLLGGTDPIDASHQARVDAKLARAKEITFGDCAKQLIEAKKHGWRNAKHAAQWTSTIDTYCASLKPLLVAKIDTDLVSKVLDPIWATKTETATRVRQRIEAVLDWAAARKYRSSENPARWKGHLQSLLAAPAKLKNVQHRPALPYQEMASFMSILASKESLAAKALTLQVLTATRPTEAIAARWSEFDLVKNLWTIPKDRMKAGREHEVPLAPELAAMLATLPHHESGFLFPGKPKAHMTTAATLKLLQGIHPGKTCHGFRSSFRDWAADSTNYPRDVAEAALAHMIKDKSEAAYRRTTMLEKRANLMQDWATHCYTTVAG
jgi:integrase